MSYPILSQSVKIANYNSQTLSGLHQFQPHKITWPLLTGESEGKHASSRTRETSLYVFSYCCITKGKGYPPSSTYMSSRPIWLASIALADRWKTHDLVMWTVCKLSLRSSSFIFNLGFFFFANSSNSPLYIKKKNLTLTGCFWLHFHQRGFQISKFKQFILL